MLALVMVPTESSSWSEMSRESNVNPLTLALSPASNALSAFMIMFPVWVIMPSDE